ncbi:DUF4124 domain-containing protein [Chitinimonas koreensis]|uniref:DUF4124 domain-containing protein n=1 Tax=Chitinimonas koreensis TaxID=356302 RepID=UPI00041A67E9|nr:DUF4124 domain-containing protein [Chitinimonas koreensis]QNM98570.1 DUF4124 domain-containing protein [Chitinimonas koreensis]
MKYASLSVLLPLAALLALAPPAAAQVYKWVDANGKVQFSDQPPPDAKAQAVKIPKTSGSAPAAAPAPAAPAAPAAGAATPSGAKPKVVEAGRAEQEAENKQTAIKNCAIARDNQRQMQKIRQADRVTMNNPDGTRRTLNGAERQAELDKVKGEVDKWCGLAGE